VRRADGSHDKFRKVKNGAGRERHNGAYGADEVLRVRKEQGIPIKKINEGCEVRVSEDLVLPGTSSCTRFFHVSADRVGQGVSGVEPYRQALW